jgi:hypothetical protein
MTVFHVLAAAGEFADELRSLGLYDAPSAHQALVRCLGQLDDDPVGDHEAARRDPKIAELARPSKSSCATRWASPTCRSSSCRWRRRRTFMRDYNGEVKPADDVERKRERMRWELGVDVM